ncbi:tail assembly chaperone [Streptococcus sp. NLN64]|uniref:tail assembly chaperone n=1 Tax=Streptococcus sp. NLN64 TaxID=2822799 RepID=UPI0018C968E1|nr:tail assembly chaperone [Streptococcus sp. NLN64]MBG9366558.1 tail assembly chaperone [Streptococcus sp. NLN64]
MKQIEINGKSFDLHYGIGFIREMDKRHEVNGNGVSFGMGIQAAVIYLQDYNPVILADIIQAATITLRNRPSISEIELWIEEQGDNLEQAFDDFLSDLKTAPMTKLKVKKTLEAMEA